MNNLKLQSAMEYLMTYGWAILIISITLGAIYMMGLFSPNSYVTSTCLFSSDFSCLNYFISSGGVLTINVEQSLSSPIEVTGIGCNSNKTVSHMENLIGNNAIYIPIGGNYTFSVQCYSGNSTNIGMPGHIFKGYVILNYTNIETGFPHVAIASLIQKIS
ncbi:MAG: hypothetical protein ACP5TL_00980 [Candidatus Micrarchaeia archaeon]